jgi:outer membrane protein TolC
MRTNRGLNLVAVAVAASLAASAGAARAETVTGELTLERALEMARHRNRSIIAERAKLLQAQTNVDQAWTALFPNVTAQGKYTRNYKEVALSFPGAARPLLLQPDNQLDLTLSFTTPILAPAAIAALDSVKTGVKASEATFEASEADMLVAVAKAYLAAAVADEVVLARRSSVEVASATVKNAETRYSAGAVTKVDVDRAQLALVNAQQLEREAGYGRGEAYRGLATLIQAEGHFTVKPQISTGPAPNANDVEMALHLRPEFRAIEASVKASNAEANARAWLWAPTLSAFGNVRKFNYDNFAQDRHSWAVGGQLDWVIFDGGNRDSQRHLADAKADEARARADVLKDSIRDDMATGQSQLETKRKGVEAADRSVALSREALELVRVQYEAGTSTQLDLLTAQDAVVAAQLGLAQAHFDVAAADLTLRHAAGTFPPK